MDKLLVIYGLGTGGAERVATTLANAWAARGEQVGIATMEVGPSHYPLHGNIQTFSLAAAATSSGTLSALRNNGARIRKLRQLIQTHEPKWVIGVATSMNVLSLLASIGTGCRTVATEHIHPPRHPLGWFWTAARKISYRLAHTVTAPTAATARWLAQNTWAQRTATLPNPIELPIPSLLPTVDPAQYLSSDHKLLLAVGRLEHQKGFDLLLSAFAKLSKQFPQWRLVILGDGSQRQDLEQRSAGAGISATVLFPGVAGNIADWYQRADLFVLSSRYEGFGYVLAEAMSQGCPCVSFDCEVGPSTIIRSTAEGELVPVGDTDQLAQRLQLLMDDGPRRQTIGAAAALAGNRFAVGAITEEWDSQVFTF